jgi:5-methylcytosine-specific restriction endonuclease McrA
MTNAATGYCSYPLCTRIEERAGLCFLHAAKCGIPKPEKAKAKIAPRAKKQEVKQKEYVKLVKSMLAENPDCEIKMPGCTGKATGLHHKQKRGPKNFLDPNNLKRCCNHCNLWIELNSKEAIKKELTISRFNKSL